MVIWNRSRRTRPPFSLGKYWKLAAWVFFFVCAVAAPEKWMRCEASGDVPVAEGGGFLLTEGDVDKVKAYYDKTPIRAPEAEHHLAAFKIKLFAHEAIQLNLDQNLGISREESDSVESWLKLADVYYQKIVTEYPVSELAIESYYRAFPERFVDDEASGGGLAEQKVLDTETRKRVRDAIVNAKGNDILSESVHNLKSKYGIEFVGNYSALGL